MCYSQIPDSRIPELVNKALMMNQEAVLNFEEASFKLSQLKEENKSLQRQIKVLFIIFPFFPE